MIVAGLRPAVSLRRCFVGDEDSGRRLCGSRDAAAGDETTAVVGCVLLLPSLA
jgi:hypothetical protein